MPSSGARLLAAAGGAALAGVALYGLHVRNRRARRDAVRARLAELMADRVVLPRGKLASETSDGRVNLPACLRADGRLQVGDLGTVEGLLEGPDDDRVRQHLAAHPVSAA